MNLFFDHIDDFKEIFDLIDQLNLSEESKAELVQIIDETIIHHMLNVVYNHLPKEHHEEFTTLLVANPSDQSLIFFINSKIDIDIETELKNHAQKIKNDIKSEVNKSKNSHAN